MNNFNGLAVVNLELTSRCNKKCEVCGRRRLEKENQELCNFGDMDLELAYHIIDQLPENIIIQFHNNGEPLLYPYLLDILNYTYKQIKCLNTNGKLLVEKADDIIEKLDTITVSVIENDPEGDEQYEIVKKFLEIKKNHKPFLIYRLLGDVGKIIRNNETRYYKERTDRWYKLPGLVATRILHNPMGSFDYTKKVTIPEVGFCQDLYSHLVIDRFGNIFPCVRFDPTKINKLGNIKDMTLEEAWNCEKRQYLLKEHIKGNRICSELCSQCQFWGIPHE